MAITLTKGGIVSTPDATEYAKQQVLRPSLNVDRVSSSTPSETEQTKKKKKKKSGVIITPTGVQSVADVEQAKKEQVLQPSKNVAPIRTTVQQTKKRTIKEGFKRDIKGLTNLKNPNLLPSQTFYAVGENIGEKVKKVLPENSIAGGLYKQADIWARTKGPSDPLKTITVPLVFGSFLPTSSTGIKEAYITYKPEITYKPTRFKATAEVKNDIIDVDVAGKTGDKYFFSKQTLKRVDDKLIGFEQGIKATSDDFSTNAMLYRGVGASKEIGTGTTFSQRYSSTTDDLLTGIYKFKLTKTKGIAVKSMSSTEELGGVSIQKNLVGQLKKVKLIPSPVTTKTTTVGIVGKTSTPNIFTYRGTTDNILRIYKGGESKLFGNVNIRGAIKVKFPTVGSSTSFNIPSKIKPPSSLSPSQKELSLQISKAISSMVTPQASITSTSQITAPIFSSGTKLFQGSAFAGLGQYEKTETQTLVSPKITPSNKDVFKSIPTTATTELTAQVPKTDLKLPSIPKYKTPSRNIPKEKPAEKFVSPFKPISNINLEIPTLKTPKDSFTFKNSFIPPFGFKLPKFQEFGYTKRAKKGKPIKSRYTPNVAAWGLNIKSFKVPKTYTSGFGALSIRPIIKTRRKKSGRRKK